MNKAIWIVLTLVLVLCAGLYLCRRSFFLPTVPKSNITQAQSQPAIPPVQTQVASSAPESNNFDDPLLKTVVDLGQSPYHLSQKNSEHSTLTCMYYPAFVVKELDMKEQGDEWTAVAPSTPENRPSCAEQHGKGEFEIKDTDGNNWAGYFSGVIGNLIFLDGDDGYNEGMSFGVFDALTGKKIFEDSSEFLNHQVLHITNKHGLLVIRYRRVYAADCSISQKKNECWEQIRKKSGLKSQSMPQCVGYDRLDDDSDPSVVSYFYEVELLPVLKQRELPGEVKCWPAD
jgi:hypothetical protein